MRRLAVSPRKVRGKRRVAAALARWPGTLVLPPAGEDAYWRPPVVQALLKRRWYRRAVVAALADAVRRLRAGAPAGCQVVALAGADDLFFSSVDVRWGEGFWWEQEDGRVPGSIQAALGLPPPHLPERGYRVPGEATWVLGA